MQNFKRLTTDGPNIVFAIICYQFGKEYFVTVKQTWRAARRYMNKQRRETPEEYRVPYFARRVNLKTGNVSNDIFIPSEI